MAWPMLEWVLETHYHGQFAPGSIAESSIIVREAGESQLIELMNVCQTRFPLIKVFSLPRLEPDRHIELGVRGEPGSVARAIADLKNGVSALGFPWTESRDAQ
jgi:molybdopterin-biosynthesis enzyme MoeA-like protein